MLGAELDSLLRHRDVDLNFTLSRAQVAHSLGLGFRVLGFSRCQSCLHTDVGRVCQSWSARFMRNACSVTPPTPQSPFIAPVLMSDHQPQTSAHETKQCMRQPVLVCAAWAAKSDFEANNHNSLTHVLHVHPCPFFAVFRKWLGRVSLCNAGTCGRGSQHSTRGTCRRESVIRSPSG